MWPSKSKAIHLPSGERVSAIQVPSLVSKSRSRVCPRALVVSHSAEGFSWADFSCAASVGALQTAKTVIHPSVRKPLAAFAFIVRLLACFSFKRTVISARRYVQRKAKVADEGPLAPR